MRITTIKPQVGRKPDHYQSLDNFSKPFNSIGLSEQVGKSTGLAVPSLPQVLSHYDINCESGSQMIALYKIHKGE